MKGQGALPYLTMTALIVVVIVILIIIVFFESDPEKFKEFLGIASLVRSVI